MQQGIMNSVSISPLLILHPRYDTAHVLRGLQSDGGKGIGCVGMGRDGVIQTNVTLLHRETRMGPDGNV